MPTLSIQTGLKTFGKVNLLFLILVTHSAIGAAFKSEFSYEPYFFLEENTSSSNEAKNQFINTIKGKFDYNQNYHDFDFNVEFFYRYDSSKQFDHGDLSEFNTLYTADNFDFLIGSTIEFWGVVESRNIVDIVNQIDFLEDVNGKQKLGQPLTRLNYYLENGTLSSYLFFGFRDREFTSQTERFGAQPEIRGSSAQYEAGNYGVTGSAIRLQQNLSLGDFSFHLYSGLDRNPSLVPVIDFDNTVFISPIYEKIEQAGIEAYMPIGNVALKYEGVFRSRNNEDHSAHVMGFEQSIFNVFKKPLDMTYFVEYLYDDRSQSAPLTIYQNDLFLGLRLSYTQNTPLTIKFGLLKDMEFDESFVSTDIEKNITDNSTFIINGRFFIDVNNASPLTIVENDSYIKFAYKRFF